MTKKDVWNMGENDLKLLQYLKDHDVKDASHEFGKTEVQIRLWLYRMRKRIKRYRWFLNNLQNLTKISQRIRKLTSDGSVPQPEWDEEE